MQVIGFNFEKILAERTERKNQKAGEKLEIKSNINVKDISPEKVDIVKDKEVLKFSFEFTIDYHPEIAKLLLAGSAIMMMEKDKAKEIMKKWKSSKKITEDVKIPLFNMIMTKSNLRALQLEEELNLPTHIPMPRIQPQQNNANYTG